MCFCDDHGIYPWLVPSHCRKNVLRNRSWIRQNSVCSASRIVAGFARIQCVLNHETVAGFARIQCVLSSCESSYDAFHSAARLSQRVAEHSLPKSRGFLAKGQCLLVSGLERPELLLSSFARSSLDESP